MTPASVRGREGGWTRARRAAMLRRDMTRPAVLQVMAGAPQGGAEAFFERLTLGLARAGVAQRLAIRRNPGRAARLRAGGLQPLQLRFGGPLDLVTRARLAAEIRGARPRAAICWMNRAAACLPPRWALPPLLRVGRLGGYYDLKYYRGFDWLIGNTLDICDWVRAQGWPERRVVHLPNFADPPAPAPADRATLGVEPAEILAVAAGRLHRNKGFDVLLAALAKAPGIRLALAGAGPEQAALERRIAELGLSGRVILLGWRDDVPALMRAADMVVVPSRHEPLGNVVLEAWAAGAPVLAAAAEGPRQLIIDGATGLLAPTEDPAALAAGMLRLAGDPALRGKLAEGGRTVYVACHAEDAVIALWRDFLEEILAEAPRR